jgi:hypothetical protein
MVTTGMKGLIPAPKGRIRHQVGHKYLEALQSKVNRDSDVSSNSSTSSASSTNPTPKGPGLNLLILGLCSGTAMDDIDFALCRFTQEAPESALYLELVQVHLLP